jgi:hypothetical protein
LINAVQFVAVELRLPIRLVEHDVRCAASEHDNPGHDMTSGVATEYPIRAGTNASMGYAATEMVEPGASRWMAHWISIVTVEVPGVGVAAGGSIWSGGSVGGDSPLSAPAYCAVTSRPARASYGCGSPSSLNHPAPVTERGLPKDWPPSGGPASDGE